MQTTSKSQKHFLLNAALTAAGMLAVMVSFPVSKASHNKALNIPKEQVTEVSFDEKTNSLSATSRMAIDSLISANQMKGKIKDIKVLAWADREYPMKGDKASKEEVKLAEKRGQSIKDYLRKSHDVKGVSVHNMAQRPNTIEKLFSASDFEVKSAAESSGDAPTADQVDLFATNARKSKALVVITRRTEE